jgi:hypothetical protein
MCLPARYCDVARMVSQRRLHIGVGATVAGRRRVGKDEVREIVENEESTSAVGRNDDWSGRRRCAGGGLRARLVTGLTTGGAVRFDQEWKVLVDLQMFRAEQWHQVKGADDGDGWRFAISSIFGGVRQNWVNHQQKLGAEDPEWMQVLAGKSFTTCTPLAPSSRTSWRRGGVMVICRSDGPWRGARDKGRDARDRIDLMPLAGRGGSRNLKVARDRS